MSICILGSFHFPSFVICIFLVPGSTPSVTERGTGNGSTRPAQPAKPSSTTWNPTLPTSLACAPTKTTAGARGVNRLSTTPTWAVRKRFSFETQIFQGLYLIKSDYIFWKFTDKNAKKSYKLHNPLAKPMVGTCRLSLGSDWNTSLVPAGTLCLLCHLTTYMFPKLCNVGLQHGVDLILTWRLPVGAPMHVPHAQLMYVAWNMPTAWRQIPSWSILGQRSKSLHLRSKFMTS